MEVKGSFYHKKGLIIDKKRLEEIQQLILEYCERIEYSAKLKNDTKINFDSYEELINYENYGHKKLVELNLRGYKDGYTSIIDIEIGEQFSFILKYSYSATCHYTFSNLDDEEIFCSKLKSIFSKSKSSFWLFSKISIFQSFVFIYSLYWGIYLLPNAFSNGVDFSSISIQILLLLIIIVAILFYALHFLDKNMWLKLFPGVVFKIGEEIEIFENKYKLRSNIFWGVIIAVIISIVGAMIYSFMTGG